MLRAKHLAGVTSVGGWACREVRNGSFRKLGGTLFGGSYNKDPTIYGTIFGSPIFGNSQIRVLSFRAWPCRRNARALEDTLGLPRVHGQNPALPILRNIPIIPIV